MPGRMFHRGREITVGKRICFHFQVCLGIDMSGIQGHMAKPGTYGVDVYARTQQSLDAIMRLGSAYGFSCCVCARYVLRSLASTHVPTLRANGRRVRANLQSVRVSTLQA